MQFNLIDSINVEYFKSVEDKIMDAATKLLSNFESEDYTLTCVPIPDTSRLQFVVTFKTYENYIQFLMELDFNA